MDEELDFNDDTESTESSEPYSAQVLRRIHEDMSMLMEDYHNMLGPLEQEDVKEFLTGYLEDKAERLDMTEELFNKVHSGLGGLGEAAAKDMEEGQEEIDSEEPEADLDSTEAEVETTTPVPSDSSDRSEDEPTGDEVIEGMEKEEKSLYGKGRMQGVLKRLRSKGIKSGKKCADCGDPNCTCGKCISGDSKKPGPCKGSSSSKTLSAEDVTSADGNLAETTDAARPEGLHQKAFEAHEKPIVSEAAQHLKAIAESPALEEEHRFKSYHYHKVLEGLVGRKDHLPGDAATEKLDDIDQMGQQGQMSLRGARHKWSHGDPGADYDLDTSTGDDLHHHRKMCKSASQFLRTIASEKNFGDPHRAEAMQHHKALNDAVNEQAPEETPQEPTPDVPVEANVSEPGEMGEKGLNSLKALFLQQSKQMEELQRTLATLPV